MILVDQTQVSLSNLIVALNTYSKSEIPDENFVRHMILNSLRSYNVKFREKYGNMILCCDGRDYWRRSFFPYYKAGRKKTRAASTLDWNLIFDSMNKIHNELAEYFPYHVLYSARAEADDIIAVLVKNKDPFEQTLIISGDRDFLQLQKYLNVDQYSPIQKKFLRTNTPSQVVKEHIIRGDASDGIPNILSPSNTFVAGLRQKPVRSAKVDVWVHQNMDEFCTTEEMKAGFIRNQMLIDFDYIPEEIEQTILDIYNTEKEKGIPNRSRLLTYFIQNRLKQLTECIHEF